ncbi:MAG: DUF6477 family protein [Rhodobacterales bacterium]
MQLEDVFSQMIRPRILMNAAKIRLQTYSRNKDLKRLIGGSGPPAPRHALERLIRRENRLEQARKTGTADYDMNLHIHIMTAVLQELYLLPNTQRKS